MTGGCGFIGSNYLLSQVPRQVQDEFLNVDVLNYAANPQNLQSLESTSRYSFAHIDLADRTATSKVVQEFQPDLVIHFAAETHVDRSIKDPGTFLQANIMGTFNLLEACRDLWADRSGKRFHQISTDEVYGELDHDGFFREDTPYQPSSPYSASKAASDHLVRAWHKTYGLPVTLSNCSNNYGPYQFPEKLIPVMIEKARTREPLPVYGDGSNVRDWLHVQDHVDAIVKITTEGKVGETYNIGGIGERTNLQVVDLICEYVAEIQGVDKAELTKLISFVPDRPGHDFRYAIDGTKMKKELGWQPQITFEGGLRQTVTWYLQNQEWLESVKSTAYLNWMENHYGK